MTIQINALGKGYNNNVLNVLCIQNNQCTFTHGNMFNKKKMYIQSQTKLNRYLYRYQLHIVALLPVHYLKQNMYRITYIYEKEDTMLVQPYVVYIARCFSDIL